MQDSTFEFEKRRNRPVRYDRELVGKTLRAMKIVDRIQKRREERFYAKRMQPTKEVQRRQDALEVEQSIKLITPAERRSLEENVVAEKARRAATLADGTPAASGGAAAATDVPMDS